MIPPAVLEQLAMYAAALPCPPLGVRLPPSEDGEEVATSHDLLAGLLMAAMTRGNRSLDELRKTEQMRVTRKFLEGLSAPLDTVAMYDYCKAFTAEMLHAFDDVNTSTRSVCMMSMDDVEMGSKVHKAACSWNAAQDILFVRNAEKRHNAQFYSTMSYRQLIEWHCQRVLGTDEVQFAQHVTPLEGE